MPKYYSEKNTYLSVYQQSVPCLCIVILIFANLADKKLAELKRRQIYKYNLGYLSVTLRVLGRCPGEGKSYPLQYSGLENSMDCIVHGLAKSWTQLSDFHFSFSLQFRSKGLCLPCMGEWFPPMAAHPSNSEVSELSIIMRQKWAGDTFIRRGSPRP